ncbi:Receptor kinase-like protein Xa21, partial [Cucurbita argyrosperma subsp. argyrosperma]
MARNKLSGPIPRAFVDLRGLQLLDLSSNHLSGPIPDELQQLNALRTLNLSFNDLEGVVPMELRNITNLYLQGNPKLCDGYFSCAATGTKGKVIKIVVVSVLSALLAIFLVFGTLVYFMRRKSKVPLSLSTEWVKGKPEMISHRELCLATDNFCPENMIGKGSFGTVYRGCLEQGIGIAVKVFNTERAGSVRSFLAECEALRHVRHRNLVKLITSCSSIDLKQQEFLALVYEFLSNGSLDSWIHKHKLHEDGSGLNLLERLNIAIDVASALDYLHNGYDVPIVHCDLKPSNIILSEDMTAKVGDFGLARFLMEGETNQSASITSSRVLKGSIGYVPPENSSFKGFSKLSNLSGFAEYGLGRKPTTAGDVYSLGVTLVELFTGKRPTDESFSGELNLMKWVELGYPKNMDEIVDAALLESRFNLYYEEQEINPRKQYDCLVDVMGVGLCCTANSPEKRISMKDVFVKLKTIRATLFLENVEKIDISKNLISGEIPSSISDCKSLEVLIMAKNEFSGQIPSSLGDILGLRALDLSSNKLTGPIPRNLQNRTALQLLNLSFNDLEGVAFEGGDLKRIPSVYLEGNPKLCLPSVCVNNKPHNEKRIKIIALTVVFSTLALCFTMGAWFYLTKRKPRTPPLSTDELKRQHDMVSYAEIRAATANFSHENLVGKGSFGSVYKGYLNQEHGEVAIKVLNIERTGYIRSFFAECEASRSVRHRKLVKLVTSCSSIDFEGRDFRALVYEFLSNGSLAEWIHGERRHLDGKYGMGRKATVAGDVYSFGITLLELFTGRSPTHEDFRGEHNLTKWVQSSYLRDLMQTVGSPNRQLNIGFHSHNEGRQVSEDKMMKCLIEVIDVGISCTADYANTRITMKDALSRLENARHSLLKTM